MTQIYSIQCDDCGCVITEDDLIKCVICGKDICKYCAEEHAKDETELDIKDFFDRMTSEWEK